MILKALLVRKLPQHSGGASFAPGRELTVICGQNGQGKTNLLEAVWMLTGGKSFRGCKGRGADSGRRRFRRCWRASAQGLGPERAASAFWWAGSRCARKARSARVNGVDCGRAASSIAGTFTAVVFDTGPPEPA